MMHVTTTTYQGNVTPLALPITSGAELSSGWARGDRTFVKLSGPVYYTNVVKQLYI